MKLRELLKKFRLPSLRVGEGEPPLDGKDDEAATFVGIGIDPAPTNWVPSQQDERPRH